MAKTRVTASSKGVNFNRNNSAMADVNIAAIKAVKSAKPGAEARRVARTANKAMKNQKYVENARMIERGKTARAIAANVSANVAAGVASAASSRRNNRELINSSLNSILSDMYGSGKPVEGQDGSTTTLPPSSTGVGR